MKRLVIPGQWIEAGRTILEIADYSAVQIEGELPESFIARVRARKTNKVRIRAPFLRSTVAGVVDGLSVHHTGEVHVGHQQAIMPRGAMR